MSNDNIEGVFIKSCVLGLSTWYARSTQNCAYMFRGRSVRVFPQGLVCTRPTQNVGFGLL